MQVNETGAHSKRCLEKNLREEVLAMRSRGEVCRADAKPRYPSLVRQRILHPAELQRIISLESLCRVSNFCAICDDVAHLSQIYLKILAMTEVHHSQLNWEASATATHPQVSSSLPSEVETCLKNVRFVSVLPPPCIYI